jgi:hypothetical protein
MAERDLNLLDSVLTHPDNFCASMLINCGSSGRRWDIARDVFVFGDNDWLGK